MQSVFLLVTLALLAFASAFVPSTPTLALRSGRTAAVSRMSGLRMQEDDKSSKRQGASIDADGKSNVWAVEPKMQLRVQLLQVQEKEEGANNALVVPGIIVAGIVVLGGILALTPITNVEQL